LIKHMLASPEDGYPAELAELRNVDESEIIAQTDKLTGMRLIKAICEGASNHSIAYCDAPRLVAVGKLSVIEQQAAAWKALATQFDDLCRRAGIPAFMRLERLSEPPSVIVKSSTPFDPDLDRQIHDAHVAVLQFLRLHFTTGQDPAIDILLKHLGDERIDPDRRAIHVDYLKVLTGRYFPPDRGVSI
jgi:hypothetical protein